MSEMGPDDDQERRRLAAAAATAQYRSREARRAKLAPVEVEEEMILFLIDARFLSEADAGDKKKIGEAVKRFHDFALKKSDEITKMALAACRFDPPSRR